MPNWSIAIVVGLATCQLGLYLTTVFLHRTVSHKAITMSRPLHWFCRLATWVLTGIQPRQWAAVHRRHHAFTDVEGDPHSPIIEGFTAVQLLNAFLYRKAANDDRTLARYARDIPEDRWDKVLFRHGLLGLGIGYLIVFAFLGWEWALVAWTIHIVTYLLGGGAINAIGHTFGKRPYDGQMATNNQWLAILVAGEGLHNNHHAAPTSARLSLNRFEFDPAWPMIRLGRALRLLTVRHDRPVFTKKAGLSADAAASPAVSGANAN